MRTVTFKFKVKSCFQKRALASDFCGLGPHKIIGALIVLSNFWTWNVRHFELNSVKNEKHVQSI